MRSVVIAGGGTGGHIEPAMALADALRRLDPDVRITCLGTERGLETKVIPARGYALDLIPAVPLPRSLTPDLARVPGRLAGAVSAAATALDRAEASVLVGFGGYVATPGYLAARRRHVPIVVHEANPRPGLANRIGARLTRNVYVGYPGTKLPHASFIGIPIRREIASLDRLALSDKARAHFGLRPDLPVLLVTGGSQGAASLNRAVIAAADALLSAGVQVLHIVGPRSGQTAGAPRRDVPYVPIEYLDRMDLAYAAADFALCRAGAMTCAELTAVGLPAAYVPLPHGNGEQRLNALPVERAGGGLIIDDASLNPDWIRNVLLGVLLDHELVASMSRGGGQHRQQGRRRQAGRERCWPSPTERAGTVLDRRGRRASIAAATGALAGEEGRIAMGLVTPVEPVPLGDLGRVHFVAIGGAGMSGIARIMLARGVPVSGCDSAASAQLDELAALGAQVGVGHSADHVHSADTLVVSSAIRQDNPELVRGAARWRAGAAPGRGPGQRHAGQAGHRRGRHPRQDHDHPHDYHRAAPLRRRPELCHRRDPRRDRPRRGRGQRPGLRRRGRRERRLVSHARARRRGRDLRRGRSSRQLRQPGARSRRHSKHSPPGSRLAACWSRARMTRAPASWRQRRGP